MRKWPVLRFGVEAGPNRRTASCGCAYSSGQPGDAAIAGLLDELGRAGPVFPRTGLRMVCEMPEAARNPGQEASRSLLEV